MKIYAFVFFLIFYLLVFVIRSWILWKQTGISPLTFDGTDDAHGFNGKLFKVIAGLEFLIIGIYSFGGSFYNYLLPFWYLENTTVQVVGWCLLHGSLFWIFIAQLQMADSWRIGIDTEHETDLITKGLFSYSRNPIFLGILIADIGLFMVMPNAFTLLVLVWSYTVIETQVRLEEAFLKKSHGAVYEAYLKSVRRWI